MSETTPKDEAIRTSHHAPKAPGPSIPSLMKSLPTMRNNLPGFMTSLTQHYGDVVRISILNQIGGGPRQCIGNMFALMEAQLILATVARRYRLRLLSGRKVEPEVLLTIRPRHGLPMPLQHSAQ